MIEGSLSQMHISDNAHLEASDTHNKYTSPWVMSDEATEFLKFCFYEYI